MNKCAYCTHEDVCKHQDEYQEVLSKIVLNVPEPFALVLNCKHYTSTTSYFTSGGNDYSNWTTNCSEASNSPKPYPAGGPEIVY